MRITAIWRKQEGKYFCICTKSQSGHWREHWFHRTEFDDVRDFIDDNKDKDVYFCPHGFNKKARKKEYAVAPVLFWADLDEASPLNMRPQPTIAIESSPGRFVGFWYTDKPVSDELNRRLTYAVGADKGGWDYTQVLRVPGTINYKYSSKPKVQTLWDNGPIYTLDKMVSYLPDAKNEREEDPEGITAQEVYDKYEKVLPRWLRKEILAGRPVSGQRSDMLWKMEHQMLDLGMSREESFVLIRNSAWNKFKNRKNGDDQLRRELDKVSHEKLDAGIIPTIKQGYNGFNFLGRGLDGYEEKEVDWVWYPYLARRMVTIVEGDPGIGKSWLCQAIAASIADRGMRKLPVVGDRFYRRVTGPVVYFDVENDVETVVKPRMRFIGLSQDPEVQKNFVPVPTAWSVDEEEKYEAIKEDLMHLKPALIVFDTINTYIGNSDIFRGNEVTQAMDKIVELAKEANCACIIVRHITKGGKGPAIYRGQGSISFAGVARCSISVGRLKDDPEVRAMAANKMNNAKTPPALTYTLESVPGLKNKLNTDATRLVWGDFKEGVTADEILEAPDKVDGTKKERAKKIILDMLDAGPRPAKDILKQCEKVDVSARIVEMVSNDLGVRKQQQGKGAARVSMWRLPG